MGRRDVVMLLWLVLVGAACAAPADGQRIPAEAGGADLEPPDKPGAAADIRPDLLALAAKDAGAGGWPHNVLVVGWDGVQRDHFFQCYDAKLADCPRGLPNIRRLSGGKIFPSTITDGATCTKPGWAQLLSGYSAKVMGIHDNIIFRALPAGYSVMEKLETWLGRDEVYTLFLAGKTDHVGGSCAGKGEPWCNAKQSMDHFENALGLNLNVGSRFLAFLEQINDRRFFAFVHFMEPDNTGHQQSESSTAYSVMLWNSDVWLGRMMDALERLGLQRKTLIYVITDHGFDEGKKTHWNAPYSITASNDPRLLRGGDRLDFAPTLLKRLGIPRGALGPAPAVGGRPLDELPTACIDEGQGFVDYPGAPGCCPQLKLVPLTKIFYGKCVPATGGQGDRSGLCTRCGDGVCKRPEQRCNCAADCQ